MFTENNSNSPSVYKLSLKSSFAPSNVPLNLTIEGKEDLYPNLENDNSTPNKIPKNFSDLIITKALISNHAITKPTPRIKILSFTDNNESQTNLTLKPFKLSEDESSLENHSISKIEMEEGNLNKINRISLNRIDETPTETKTKKKFSSDYFNERKRPGFPTLTQKKRDLAPLLELEGFETNSFKESEHLNNDEYCSLRKSDEKPHNYIMNELENIDRLKTYKNKMEKFVILFNNKPETGIKYLIENKIKTTKEDIANILLTYEGLSKDNLGQYFGSPDNYNQEIFNHFCSLLDFTKLELDQALRLLLSRFKLPGEAQQIDRIVQTFSKKYGLDNPQAFNDEDTPYILSYSAIMLSTDAFSKTISQKNKMKKHQFVENNKKICPSTTIEFLEGMYDRITSQKFETQTDDISVIYERLHMSQNDGKTDQNQGAMEVLMKENLQKDLIKGQQFLKYGRKGKPKQRLVYLDQNNQKIYWKSVDKKKESSRSISLSEVVDLLLGVNTTAVMKRNKVPIEFDRFCFSIVTFNRSLDLKAGDIKTRVKWVKYLKNYLVAKRDRHFAEKADDKKLEGEDKNSEIWRVDIFPNWDMYFDYKKKRPTALDSYRNLLKKEKKNNKNKNETKHFFSCFTTRNSSSNKGQFVFSEQIEENENNSKKNNQFLLVKLWKTGLPAWVRKTLWPIVIGNRLEITKELYRLVSMKLDDSQNESHPFDKLMISSINQMEKELVYTFPKFYIFEDENKKKNLRNILKAFIFYRLDLGYVRGMTHLAAVLLLFLDEYEAFSCLLNLTHSHHFLSFLRGDVREIEWRVNYFDDYFQKELPNLFQHFKALDLSTEVFLLHCSKNTIKSRSLNSETIPRIWDCFFLEGEVYGVKVGLGILKYYELELRLSTFDEAVNLLQDLKNTNETILFKYIEEINIPDKEYTKYLIDKKKADLNSMVHEAMLH